MDARPEVSIWLYIMQMNINHTGYHTASYNISARVSKHISVDFLVR